LHSQPVQPKDQNKTKIDKIQSVEGTRSQENKVQKCKKKWTKKNAENYWARHM